MQWSEVNKRMKKKKKMKKNLSLQQQIYLMILETCKERILILKEPLKISYVIRYHTSKLLAFFFS